MKRTSALRYDIHHNSTGITLACFGRFAVLETGDPITAVGVRRYRVGPITVSLGRVYPKTPTPLRLAQPTTVEQDGTVRDPSTPGVSYKLNPAAARLTVLVNEQAPENPVS